MRYCGTQIEDNSTIPMRRLRMPLQRAVHDEVGDGDRGRDPQEDGFEHRNEALVGVGVEGIVEHPGLIGHMEHRRHPVMDEGRPEPVVVRMRQRPPVHRRRGDHAEVHAGGSSCTSCDSNHTGSRKVRWATGWRRPCPSVTTVAHQRFHAAMLAVRAGRDPDRRRSHSSPKFGKTTASSTPRTLQVAGTGRWLPVVRRQGVVVIVFRRQ